MSNYLKTYVYDKIALHSYLHASCGPVKYFEVTINYEGLPSAEKAKEIYLNGSKMLNENEEIIDNWQFRYLESKAGNGEAEFYRRNLIFSTVFPLMFERLKAKGEDYIFNVDHDYRYYHSQYNDQGCVLTVWNENIDSDTITEKVVDILKEFDVYDCFSVCTKIKTKKYSSGTPAEDYLLADPFDNAPLPGDKVIIQNVRGRDKCRMDTFIGWNKKSWKCLNSTGYGYVVKRYDPNSPQLNFGED